MSRRASRALKAVLVVLALGTLLMQALLPVVASGLAQQYWELEPVATAYAVLGILALASFGVALVALWMLASMVETDRVFSSAALRWVDVLRASLVATFLLAGTPMAHLLFGVGVGGPGILLALAGTLVIGVGAGLLMTVLRGLLVAATTDRAELEVVI